jgi:hypothetical protein
MDHVRDIRHVTAFVAVADLLHVGRAAEALGVSRSTVSERLGALESVLGLVLVDRSHRRRIALTPEGHAMLPVARTAIAAREAMASAATDVREGRRGVVRVAVLCPHPGSEVGIATPGRAGPAQPGCAPMHVGADADDRGADDRGADDRGAGDRGAGGRPGSTNGAEDRGVRERGAEGFEVTGGAAPGAAGDQPLRELGEAGEQLADALSGTEDGWRVEFRVMDRRSAYRAMAVGGIECAIGLGGPLRRPPGAYDPRPNRLERTRSIGIVPRRDASTSVTWRASWVTSAVAGATGAARIMDRLVGTAQQLADRALDQRFPARASAREAVAERLRAVDAARTRLAEDTRRFGRTIALRRARAVEREAVIARYEAARAAGSVSPSLLVDWMVETGRPDPETRGTDSCDPETHDPAPAPRRPDSETRGSAPGRADPDPRDTGPGSPAPPRVT